MAKKKKDKDSKSKKGNSQSKAKTDFSNLINTLKATDTDSIIPELETHKKSEEESIEEIESPTTGVKEFPSFMDTGKNISQISKSLPSEEKLGAMVEELSKMTEQENTLVPPPPPPPQPPVLPSLTEQELSGNQNNKESADSTLISDSNVADVKPGNNYITTGNLFGDIGVFLTELTDSYKERYDLWEESTNNILDTLKTLEKNDKQNSDILNDSLQKFDEKILKGLDRFKIKRDFSAKYTDADFNEVNRTLKKTLLLLSLQLKEIKLKDLINEITEIYSK